MYTGRYPYIGTVAAAAGAVSIVVFACYLITRRRKGIKLAPVNILSAVIVFFAVATAVRFVPRSKTFLKPLTFEVVGESIEFDSDSCEKISALLDTLSYRKEMHYGLPAFVGDTDIQIKVYDEYGAVAMYSFFTDAPEKSVVVLGDGYWAVIGAEDMLDELRSIIEAAQT